MTFPLPAFHKLDEHDLCATNSEIGDYMKQTQWSPERHAG
jgi:hypothetical protein